MTHLVTSNRSTSFSQTGHPSSASRSWRPCRSRRRRDWTNSTQKGRSSSMRRLKPRCRGPPVTAPPSPPDRSDAAGRQRRRRTVAWLGIGSVTLTLLISGMMWQVAARSASSVPAIPRPAVPDSTEADPSAPGPITEHVRPRPAGFDPQPAGAVTAAAITSRAAKSASAPSATDAGSVESVLAQYRGAFNALDATTIRRFWPSVNTNAVARTFGQLKNQEVTFDRCAMDVTAATAVATCRGRAAYTPKAGSGTLRVERRRWPFRLAKRSGVWVIRRVDSSRGN